MEIDLMDIFLWRAVERLANVLIGALAILLGYKLFIKLPERTVDEKGEMKMGLPGGISVYASRIGPGVFFALFGTVVVLMSFLSPVTLSDNGVVASPIPSETTPKDTGQPDSDNKVSKTISYSSGQVDADRFSIDRAVVKRDLATVRTLEAQLMTYVGTGNWPQMSANKANTLINTLQRIKRVLLLDVWDPAWGDPEDFSNWVQKGAIDAPPPEVQEVADLFKVAPQEE